MSATSLRRAFEESDKDDEPSVQPSVSKRAKLSPAEDMLALFASLGLPMTTALTKSYTHFSTHTPATEGYVLGVDEAGRGPVLGPMVYATCFCPESYYTQLSSLGFADSKQLTEDQRDKLFTILQAHPQAGWSIRCISPQDISQCMLRRSKYNLNALAHDATIQLIRDTLQRGIDLRRVFIDTVGPPLTYQKRLQELFPGVEITVAKKADSLYPIVSAASVCAKVTRDAHLSNWVFAEGSLQLSTKYGSGYPSDPNTVRWLKESVDHVFGFPGIIRFSWSTCVKLLDDSAAKIVWADDEESVQNNAKLMASKFFGAKQESTSRQRSKFFTRRRPIVLAVTL
ncbi:hypothetical protein GGH94_005210 [Coemansia aciculifera]|uniref:Ribonuclease n=1 Tax=Coemansia aciculifera TaxID=417176 RepID=A0A9W8IDW7_9FUNG|nr:hypothetical protein GGH94_005210 [Coemansia aciculifera]KAJ2871178.1 hypothetical protein GGH93_005026 [Coemansia aciculifera]